MFLLFEFIFLFIYVNAQNDTSPCPRLFIYEGKSPIPYRWYGIITLLSDYDLEGVWLRMLFNSEAQQVGNWFGEVQSNDDNTEFIITNPNYNLKAFTPNPIRFYVQYERNKPIPRLVSFLVNGKTVCPEQKSIVRTTPAPTLQTSGIYTTKNSIISPTIKSDSSLKIADDDDYFIGDFAVLTQNRTESITKEGCGTVVVQQKLSNGHETNEGEYPWQANVYYASNIDLVYICGGSLISKSLIVTAAHCFYKNFERIIFSNELTVYLGKFYLRRFTNVGIQDRAVTEIIIHPLFNSTSNDIALLKLDIPVLITNYVRPICLWQEEIDLKYTIGKQGVTVGWGFDVNGQPSLELTQTKMQIVSQQKCFFPHESSRDNFCATFNNDVSICNVDSGAGMYFSQKTTNGNIWQLRGLVSINRALQKRQMCDSTKYVIFTDVTRYVKWIKQFI